MRRIVWLLLSAVTAAGILLLFVFPGRTLLAQDRDIAVARQHIVALDRQNAALVEEKAALTSPAQVEQIARSRFDLVPPGATAYDITGPPAPAAAAHKAGAPRSVPHHDFWRDLELWR